MVPFGEHAVLDWTFGLVTETPVKVIAQVKSPSVLLETTRIRG